VGLVVGVGAAACGGPSDDAASGTDQAVSASHDVFDCDLSNGDSSDGDKFKLTLGDGVATVEGSDIGKHSGKLGKSTSSDPSGSERYLISGLADEGVTSLVVPKNLRTNTRGTVHIESTVDPTHHQTNDFLCHPVDASSAPPSTGRGSGASSPVQATIDMTCELGAKEDSSFPDKLDVVLKGSTLSLKGGDMNDTGPFDTAFKPKTNTSFVRYLVDGLVEENTTDVLVEKPILTGKAGKLKIEAKGEGFETVGYTCSPK
jgi:hypothetical protein